MLLLVLLYTNIMRLLATLYFRRSKWEFYELDDNKGFVATNRRGNKKYYPRHRLSDMRGFYTWCLNKGFHPPRQTYV